MQEARFAADLAPRSIEAFSQPGVRFKSLADFKEEAELALAFRIREHSPCVQAFINSALSSVQVGKR